jgi:hypothetical protein
MGPSIVILALVVGAVVIALVRLGRRRRRTAVPSGNDPGVDGAAFVGDQPSAFDAGGDVAGGDCGDSGGDCGGGDGGGE